MARKLKLDLVRSIQFGCEGPLSRQVYNPQNFIGPASATTLQHFLAPLLMSRTRSQLKWTTVEPQQKVQYKKQLHAQFLQMMPVTNHWRS
ncbi:hypothetical protein QQP08_027391 [Theobroma cacao]|nr:hypothetical protein QQP08_027391 [Theobroma cacao]